MGVSLAHTLGLKEWRESCPWPIFSRQAGVMLQFDTVTAGLQCHGEALTAHPCPLPCLLPQALADNTRPSNLLPSELCFPHQATDIHPCFWAAAPQKTLGTPNLDPSHFMYPYNVLFLSLICKKPPLACHPLFVGRFLSHLSSSCWAETLWNLVSHQLLETWAILNVKGWRMKCLSRVRMVLMQE